MESPTSCTPTSWISLPNELRIQILTYILPRCHIYRAEDFVDPGQLTSGPVFEYHSTVRPLLCVPEARDIVAAEFFGKTTLSIFYGEDRTSLIGPSALKSIDSEGDEDLEPILLYPPKYVRPHLRKLQIIVNEMTLKIIEFFEFLGTPDFGLGTLELIDIMFACAHKTLYYNGEDVLQKLEEGLVIRLPTRHLNVVYDHKSLHMVHDPDNPGRTECKDFLEMPLLQKLSVKLTEGSGSRLKETWERFEHDSLQGRVCFDAWPSRRTAWRNRTTMKRTHVI